LGVAAQALLLPIASKLHITAVVKNLRLVLFFIFIIIPSPAFKIIKLVFYAVFVRPISYTGKT